MRLGAWRLGGGLFAAAGVGLAVATFAHGTAQGKTGTQQTGTTTSATVTNPKEALPGYGKPPVLLGDENTPEQFILGQLYAQALTAEGYRVQLTANIGPPAVTQQALAQGSLDVYPEYLDVWDGQVVGMKRQPRTLAWAFKNGQRYARAHKLRLLPPTPFSDTAGIAVTSEYASGNHLRKIGSLHPLNEYLTFGGPLPFLQGPDGLHALEHAYHFKPARVQALDVGSSYGDLSNGVVQAAYASTTDPQLADTNYRLLADPKHVMGVGNVVPVVSTKTLKAEGPAFVGALEQVDVLLTTTSMRGLNAEVELKHRSPDTVARTFLQGNGILPPPWWSKNGVLPAGGTTTSATDTTGAGTR